MFSLSTFLQSGVVFKTTRLILRSLQSLKEQTFEGKSVEWFIQIRFSSIKLDGRHELIGQDT